MVLVMGVLNVTPDSFSDGGRWFDHSAAVAHGRRLISEGADIVDVGGESTRPGAQPVGTEEEMRRVIPVVRALAAEAEVGVEVSIDTRKAAVAEAAVAAGATIVNDVSASLWPVAAAGGAGWIAMHCPADPSVMAAHARYHDVVAEVRDHLVGRAQQARAAGVSRVWIDPGIGFGKDAGHNLSLLRHLDDLVATGWPVAVGTSRKSFLGPLAAGPSGPPAPVGDRLEPSVATAAWAVARGAAMVRVHDVRATAVLVRLASPAAEAAPGAPAAAAAGSRAGAR